MSKRYVWATGLVIVLLLIISAFVVAQSTAVSEATLVVNNGEVVISRAGTDKLYTAVSGETVVVTEGDTVTTSAATTAQLHLKDGGTVDLFASTSVEITELVTTEEKYQVTLTMLTGRTLNRVIHLLGIEDHYEVRSPSSTASVRGTVFTVDVLSQESTYVSVDEGIVNVAMGDQNVDVKAAFEVTAVIGELLMVKPQHQDPPPVDPTPEPIPTEAPLTPTVEPTEEPEPTAVPEEDVTNHKNGSKEQITNLVLMPTLPAPTVDPGIIPGQPGNGNDPSEPPEPSDDPEDKTGGNPHDGMVVPGSPPGEGGAPEGGAEPPGQGGTPPGQTDNPGNGGDNNSGGNGGGKKGD